MDTIGFYLLIIVSILGNTNRVVDRFAKPHFLVTQQPLLHLIIECLEFGLTHLHLLSILLIMNGCLVMLLYNCLGQVHDNM